MSFLNIAKPRLAWGSLLIALPLLVWTGGALYFHLPKAVWLLSILIPLAAFGLAVWMTFKGRRAAWLFVAGLFVVIVAGWHMVRPQQDRAWVPELSRNITGTVDGSVVHLSNVRDFRWQTYDDAEPSFIEKTVDLDQLESVDFISTVWDSPHIAHTMVGFGFSDGQRVVFSAEIRREKGEKFSEIGGFFKQFELVLIGATEEDIVQVRTHVRKEQVSIYPLSLTPKQRRDLFLTYLELGNSLDRKPRWYQTITTNCTTVIWKLARSVDKRLPMDWRVLLSGYTQDYLYDIGVIAPDKPMEQIRKEALTTPYLDRVTPEVNFSRAIRGQN